MRKLIFIGILIVSALSSNRALGQVTAVGCTMDASKYSSAIGYQTTASGKYSLASGYGIKATAGSSYIFGSMQTGGDTWPSTLITTNNTQNSFMIVFEGHPVFFARLVPPPPKERDDSDSDSESEEGRDVSPPSYQTGTPAVGIGTIDPQEALDVRGSIIAEGNMTADTVKIKSDIFLSNHELSFTHYLKEWEDNITLMTLKAFYNEARLGIGTADPQTNLHVKGNSYFQGKVGIGILNPAKTFHVEGNSYFNGDIGIGTTNTFGYTLAVNGNIGCKEVKVEVSNSWPDYVFAPEYDLKTLQELDSYVKEHQHLPEMPSAKQVMEEGIGLSEMNALLLKKIEELTLYIIQQNARIEALEQGR